MKHIDELEAIEEELKKLKEVFPVDMKAAVLQAAMQGKLTEQLETDSSVNDLLEDIKREREKLVAEGKIKKSRTKQNDNFVQFEDGEELFTIPDNWRWVNFGGVVSLLSGQDLTPDKYNNSQNGTIYLTGASNIENGDIVINRWTTEPKSIAYRGDILLTCKGTIGKIAILQEDKAHIARQIMSISPILVNKQFVTMFLEHYVSKLKNKAKSIIPGIERKDITDAPFPLPPVEEQNRIVANLEQILPLIADLS